jgi:hypothetical protein
MPEIENPYRTEDKRKPAQGELAHLWANSLAMWSQLVGVHFTVQETEALGTVINRIMQSYPRLRDIAVDLGTKGEHKG